MSGKLQKVNSFFTEAPDKVKERNNAKYRQFQEKLAKKSETNKVHPEKAQMEDLVQEEPSSQEVNEPNTVRQPNSDLISQDQTELGKLTEFVTDAPTQITRQSTIKIDNFQQKLWQKQAERKQGRQVAPQVSTHEVVSDKSIQKVEDVTQMGMLNEFIFDAPVQIKRQSTLQLEQFQQKLIAKRQNQVTARKLQSQVQSSTQQNENQPQNPHLEIQVYDDLSLLGSIPLEQVELEKRQVQKLSLFLDRATNEIRRKNTTTYVSFSEKLALQAQQAKALKAQTSKLVMPEETDFKTMQDVDFTDVKPNSMDEPEITSIIRSRTPNQEASLSEASQIMNLMQPSSNPKNSKKLNPNSYHKQLKEELDQSRYLNEKERLKAILQEELIQINQEIREMRGNRQYSDKNSKKQLANNSVKEMIQISDNKYANNQAQDLVKRMNQQRREKRDRQKQEYAKIEKYMRDEITQLRMEQDSASQKMELNRKQKIQQRIDNYNKRQLQFAQLQQANQQFVRQLITKGPQDGNLAQEFEEHIYKIKGEPGLKKFRLKEGAVVYLPSIHNRQEQNIFHLNEPQEIQKLQPRNISRPLHAKLPKIQTPLSVTEQMMQVELERAMVERYKQSRNNILIASYQGQK